MKGLNMQNNLFCILLFLFFLFPISVSAQTSYRDSPYNYRNSPHNYQNSPYNYDNNPNNYKNSRFRYNNERIIRDNKGKAIGYAVPKRDGGVNYFDFRGNRTGYKPGK